MKGWMKLLANQKIAELIQPLLFRGLNGLNDCQKILSKSVFSFNGFRPFVLEKNDSSARPL